MRASRTSGVLWLVAGIFGILTTIVFRVDPTQWLVTLVAGLVAGALGLVIIGRGSPGLVQWSTVLGIAWVALYAGLAFLQAEDPAAWTTDVALALIGAAAAALAFRADRQGRHSAA